MQFKVWLAESELKSKQDTWITSVHSDDIPKFIHPRILSDKLGSAVEMAMQLAEEYDLPKPIRKIDEGTQAHIFDTKDPNIILRISNDDVRNSCEKIIEKPEFQATGGVNVVYKVIRKDKLLFSWKEKVIVNWLDDLTAKYKYDRKKTDALFNLESLNRFAEHEEALARLLNTLRTIPETENIVSAIELGIPTDDVTGHNLGLSKPDSKFPNSIQVIDC